MSKNKIILFPTWDSEREDLSKKLRQFRHENQWMINRCFAATQILASLQRGEMKKKVGSDHESSVAQELGLKIITARKE